MLPSPTDKSRRKPRVGRPLQQGQAYMEYVVVVLLVVLALLAGKESVMTQLLVAFKSFYSAFSFTLSLA